LTTPLPPAQHALDLRFAPRLGAADFLVSDSNREAFERIGRWPDWRPPALVLYGPAGSGKTHLAHLWCERAGAALVAGDSVTTGDAAALAGNLAVDDADRAAETPLFHLYNLCRERGGSLLLTARAPPAAQRIALADLASRLRALPVVALGPPDDALLAAVLVKHFADRQIGVEPSVIAYLLSRIERSFAGAAAIVAALDRRALSARRAVTVALVREVLAAADAPLNPDRPAI